jgi:cytochrome oxidase Cu insertion factor (SCO1/SenC/PrrC family)
MKNLFLTFALLTLPILANAQATNYSVGDVVDDFTVVDTEGVEHNLYSITASGKYVFLDFFFVNCGPCQTWQATYNQLHDKYGCNEGEVYCLSINNGFDNNAQVIQYEETYGGPYNHAPAVSNEGGGEAVDANFGISAYPTFCLINPDNVIINTDIWPLTGIETFEAAFPADFNPEPMQCNVLSIVEQNEMDIAIYPNPVNSQDALHVRLSQPQSGTFTVYSTNGRVLLQGSISGDSVDIPVRLASGTYFLSIEGDKGSANMNFVVR